MSSTYKELNSLRRVGGKYFDDYEKLSPEQISKLKQLNWHIRLTKNDLLKKIFDREKKKKQILQEKEDSNIMNLLSRGK
jgi:hypothetical protein